jgi:hypothetical protein
MYALRFSFDTNLELHAWSHFHLTTFRGVCPLLHRFEEKNVYVQFLVVLSARQLGNQFQFVTFLCS